VIVLASVAMDIPEFRPAWWLPGPHAQTLGARVLRKKSGVKFNRERLKLPDGDFLDLDWVTAAAGKEVDAAAPLVIVLHGLEGSAQSGYALQLYRELVSQDLRPVGLNFRGCSGEPNRLPRAYHSGETGDLAWVVRLLSERHPDRPLGLVGVSLGGNVLLKYLGESVDKRRSIAAAAAISVPYDLSAGADYIEQGFSSTYRAFLVRKLKRKVRAKLHVLNGRVDTRRALAAHTFREFDGAVIVPLHGFEDAEDYYRRSSSDQFLGSIEVPTLLVHSLDDPFLPRDAVPLGAASENPHIQTAFTALGGHVGFVTGPPWSPVFWAELTVARFLAARLSPEPMGPVAQ
jgi:predicted alpha/beta-fold hydrolase